MALDLEKYLSDVEKEKIIKFNNDPILKNAVRKVLLESIYNNGTLREDVAPEPTRNAALALAIMAQNGSDISNEKLGEDIRAMAQGITLLEQGLAHLEKIKSNEAPEGENKVNPAI